MGAHRTPEAIDGLGSLDSPWIYGPPTVDGLSAFFLGLLAVAATVFAIRTTVKFDLNQYLKDRRERAEENLRLLCPHVEPEQDEGGRYIVKSLFASPPGQYHFHCEHCGRVTNDRDEPRRNAQYWAENPMELIARLEKMQKKAKKLGRG